MSEQPFHLLKRSNDDIYGCLFSFPNECPHCHKHIIPKFISSYVDNEQDTNYVTLLCSNTKCDKPFLTKYLRETSNEFSYESIVKYSVISEYFSDEINEISTMFQKIYNEAFFAEQNNLFEICGVGYRKALEFLLKDYLISLFPDKEESIKNSSISNCINLHVQDTRLKSTSSRAIWLGNDETHYERKRDDKNLNDLKTLIKLTINWIESEVLTKKFHETMP